MANAPQGYGPPKVGNLRAVRIAERERALVAGPPDAPAPLLRIEVRGEEEFPMRAMPLMIRVGDRGYLASEISADGRTIGCELAEIPAEGAVIRVGYPPDDFTELPERFSLSMLEDAEPGGGS
jgi:hypothetical protein